MSVTDVTHIAQSKQAKNEMKNSKKSPQFYCLFSLVHICCLSELRKKKWRKFPDECDW